MFIDFFLLERKSEVYLRFAAVVTGAHRVDALLGIVAPVIDAPLVLAGVAVRRVGGSGRGRAAVEVGRTADLAELHPERLIEETAVYLAGGTHRVDAFLIGVAPEVLAEPLPGAGVVVVVIGGERRILAHAVAGDRTFLDTGRHAVARVGVAPVVGRLEGRFALCRIIAPLVDADAVVTGVIVGVGDRL